MVLPITPTVKFDWNNDEDFGDADEDVSADVVSATWRRGRQDVNDDYGMGTATVVLDNRTDIYSPFDSSSAIFPNMVPGRLAKIEAVHNSITYGGFYGRISSIRQFRAPNDAPLVELQLEDDFGRQSRGRMSMPDATIDTTRFLFRGISDVLMGLSMIGPVIADLGIILPITNGHVVAETSIHQITSGWWFNASHLEILKSIAHQELGGAYFIAAGGALTFHNRHHNSLEPVHATFTGMQTLDMEIRQSDFIDEVRHKRAGFSTSTEVEAVYQLFPVGRKLAQGSTDSLNTIFGEYIGAATSAVTPEPVTDYTANALANGLGQDLTDQVSVDSFTSFGGGFKSVWDNASGQTAYLMKLIVRAIPVRVSGETREIVVSDSNAPVKNQVLTDTFEFNDDEVGIRSYALFRLVAGVEHHPRRMKIQLKPRTDAEAVSILGVELNKRLTITNTSGLYDTTIDEDYIVQSIQGRFIKGQSIVYDVGLWHEFAALGNFFRISGVASYSTIVGAAATTGDRIGY